MPAPAALAVRLRPGLHVVRRDAGHVQIGLDPPQRVIVPADAAHLSVLDELRHGGAVVPGDPLQERLVRELAAADLLLDAPDARHARHARQGVALGTVSVRDHGLGAGADRLRALVKEGAVTVVDPGPGDPGGLAELVVLCAAGPLPRAVVDPLLADGTPHLVVCGTGVPGSVRLGPLVEPGRTACLRCIDAVESTQDPRRALVVEQLAVRTAAPVDHLTLELALVWAARDVATFLSGGRPTTWSATLDAHSPSPAPRSWPRHPDCGCCWDELPY